jgi:hypothetical protein
VQRRTFTKPRHKIPGDLCVRARLRRAKDHKVRTMQKRNDARALKLARMVLCTPGLPKKLYLCATAVVRHSADGEEISQGYLTEGRRHYLFEFLEARIKEGQTLHAAASEAAEHGSPRNLFPLTIEEIIRVYEAHKNVKRSPKGRPMSPMSAGSSLAK